MSGNSLEGGLFVIGACIMIIFCVWLMIYWVPPANYFDMPMKVNVTVNEKYIVKDEYFVNTSEYGTLKVIDPDVFLSMDEGKQYQVFCVNYEISTHLNSNQNYIQYGKPNWMPLVQSASRIAG